MSSRHVAGILIASLLVQGCGGPLVSEYKAVRDVGSPAHRAWNENGNYCLPKTVLSVEVDPAGKVDGSGPGKPRAYQVEGTVITLTPQAIPDLSESFSLNYNASMFASDVVKVEYVKEPFGTCVLSKITSANDDKTGEIVEKLAALTLRAVTGVPGAGPSEPGKGVEGEATKGPQRIQLVLDGGLDQFGSAQDRMNAALSDAGYDFSVSIAPMGSWPQSSGTEPQTGKQLGGIVFRAPQPFKFSVVRGNLTLAETIFYSESGAPRQFMPIRRSAFVKRETTIDFVNGFPVSIETKKPSQMSAFVNLPLDIVTAVLSAPGQLLTVRVTETQNQSTLLRNQAAIIENQKALYEKTQEMDEFLQSQKLRPSS